MSTCLNFESAYRAARAIHVIHFATEDGTLWRLTEKWRLSKKNEVGMQQRLSFRKINNYVKNYDIQIDIFSKRHEAPHVIRRFRRAKPVRTVFRTSLLNLHELGYSNPSKLMIAGIDILEDVLTDCFRFKVTIRRASEQLRIPRLDNWMIFSDQMRWLLEKKIFWDGKIKHTNDIFKIHKCIFMCRSSQFKAFFEKDRSQNTVGVDKISLKTLIQLMSFVYRGIFFLVDIKRIVSLYTAAQVLRMDYLVVTCRRIIEQFIDPHFAATVLRIAHLYKDSDLETICKLYIAKNLSSVVTSDQQWQIIERDFPQDCQDISELRQLLIMSDDLEEH